MNRPSPPSATQGLVRRDGSATNVSRIRTRGGQALRRHWGPGRFSAGQPTTSSVHTLPAGSLAFGAPLVERSSSPTPTWSMRSCRDSGTAGFTSVPLFAKSRSAGSFAREGQGACEVNGSTRQSVRRPFTAMPSRRIFWFSVDSGTCRPLAVSVWLYPCFSNSSSRRRRSKPSTISDKLAPDRR